MLRHSDARSCTIIAGTRPGAVWLEITNDGVRSVTGSGTGLDGLAQRARALGGTVSAGRTRDDRFGLRLEVPEEIA